MNTAKSLSRPGRTKPCHRCPYCGNQSAVTGPVECAFDPVSMYCASPTCRVRTYAIGLCYGGGLLARGTDPYPDHRGRSLRIAPERKSDFGFLTS